MPKFKNERTITPGEWKSVITHMSKSASHDFNDREVKKSFVLLLLRKSRHATWVGKRDPQVN